MSTIDVDAAVLKAEWVWPVQPHDYYWSRYIDGQLDIAEVPGDHNAMFYPENAPRLAEVLSDRPRATTSKRAVETSRAEHQSPGVTASSRSSDQIWRS